MSIPSIRWAGTRAFLVELDALDAVLSLHAQLLEHPLPGQRDVLAAAETVLLRFETRVSALAGHAAVEHLDFAEPVDVAGRTVTIEVVYDGEDLAEVGKLTGLGPDGVVEAHTAQTWTAAFGGFAPGFAYLHGENNVLDVPRRDTPRTAVPAGSVALAGHFSAVYPGKSPGGWQLIGRTSARMWELGRDEPALVRPGDSVRFVAVAELTQQADDDDAASGDAPAVAPARALEVVAPGMQSLIQDLGRPGYGDLGVSASGALDVPAARQANRLVGNSPTDAVIETVFGGLVMRARGDVVVALAGAETPTSVSGARGTHTAPMRSPFALLDGETLTLETPVEGLRTYLGVRGGLSLPKILGSRSTDTLSGVGPAPLSAGTMLPIGRVEASHIVGHPEPTTQKPLADDGAAILRITTGPRADWFDRDALQTLTGSGWAASAESNRVGVRLTLDGVAPLQRTREGELASEGAVAGALQVPPSGLPVLFLADHPVTGGYPVIAVVVPEDLPVAAQLAPGAAIRFVVVDPDTLQPELMQGGRS
ncbi:5-oxoprolinase/urea amidolyase family protein [Arthrobacter roseus]|uniref:5-oxoprolinase subunit B/C family protein n=1 Tax=Arthrobacter roseus TaxID=136274 RepID=UPI001962F25B|nr:5-oxoprolinase/urea amidolyase family protein [Arthrobacter roseus]MBM7847542.1 KipI family sensor histidine kinase inhibitor [Arthrobacter roseus]